MNELFLSQLKGVTIVTRKDEEVGKILDVVVFIGELFPRVTGFLVSSSQGQGRVISMKQVGLISRRLIIIDIPIKDIVWLPVLDQELLLAKELLDKQIVDIDGAKVVRVNDLKLARLNEEWYLVAADVGLRGLLRRFGLEKGVESILKQLGKTLPFSFISWELVEPLGTETSRVKLKVSHQRISKLHPADIAEIIASVAPPERQAIFDSLESEMAAEALQEMEPQIQLEILDNLTEDKASQIVEEMSPDDAADLLRDLPEDKARTLLDAISRPEAEEIKELLEYNEDTAGGLMTTEYIAIKSTLTAEETIQKLRELSPEAETIYYLYVVDEEEHLTGVLSLRELIISPPGRLIQEILHPKALSVSIDASKEEVANLMNKYDFLAVPVLDEEKKLVGIITVDDVLDLLMPVRWKRRQ